jgi:hypothetical protein
LKFYWNGKNICGKELIDELKGSSMENTDFLVCYAKYYSNLGNPRRSIEICKKALELKEEENFLHNLLPMNM